MKIEKYDGSQERRILIGMIVDPVVLGRIAPKWEEDGLFRSKWANLIGGWCVDFYDRYEKAPRRSIEAKYESWASKTKDQETIDLVEKLLDSLSGEYEAIAAEINSDHIVDTASTYFNKVRVAKFKDEIEGDIDSGRVDDAIKRIEEFGRLEVGTGAGIDVLHDQEAVRLAFAEKEDPLIEYPGALANFFGDSLERDALIAFMGPEKRGKTWWLIDVAWRGMLQRRKVAFFEVGDMSQNQMMRRLIIRAARRPLKAKTIKYPKFIERDVNEAHASVDLIDKSWDHDLSWQKGWKACREVVSKCKTNDTLLKLSCHPNSSINVNGIKGILKSWERDGWVPDIIVVDYADILAPPTGVAETREQINMTWKQLRALSQSLHCLVVTATQSDAASYRAEVIDRTNFSEDKRKLAHANGIVGLNATPEEKEMGLMRLNWVVLREDEFIEGKCVHVAGCLPIGNPALLSTF